jgi:hypothetical protein
MTLLNGNQTMVLMTAFTRTVEKNQEKINGKQFVGSTIVSTPDDGIATNYNVNQSRFDWI